MSSNGVQEVLGSRMARSHEEIDTYFPLTGGSMRQMLSVRDSDAARDIVCESINRVKTPVLEVRAL